MANYFKSVSCPICDATLSFEDISTVYHDMARGFDAHLRTHTVLELTNYIQKIISAMPKYEKVGMIVSQKLNINYKAAEAIAKV